MILIGQIEKVVRSEMSDKKTGAKSIMVMLVISDKTKPHQFRTASFFCTFLTEEKLSMLFGPNDPIDEPVTVAVSELGTYNALFKVKGQLLSGRHTGQEILNRQGVETSAVTPPAPVVERRVI